MAKRLRVAAKAWNEEDALRRAFAAWFRSGQIDQPSNSSLVMAVDGMKYAVLLGGRQQGPIAAVYRLRNNGTLRRLKRWPKAIDQRV